MKAWDTESHCNRQVIRDGRPCHLYMDLEYVPAMNPDADGDALVDALLALVSHGIRSGHIRRVQLGL